jgi:hypothetical protein
MSSILSQGQCKPHWSLCASLRQHLIFSHASLRNQNSSGSVYLLQNFRVIRLQSVSEANIHRSRWASSQIPPPIYRP